jgi:speckle-type POZ protein
LQVSVVGETVNVAGQSNYTPVKVSECKLSEDLGTLLDREQFCDVTLSVGGRDFHAHKAILAGMHCLLEIFSSS